MLTLKVRWNSPDFPHYSMYQASKYTVSKMNDGTWQLLIFNESIQAPDSIDIRLGEGCQVYAMNDQGATVDRLFV